VTVSTDAGHDYATAVSLGSPVTSDNCSVAGLTNNAPSQFPAGTNVVTWTVTDASGNQNSCAQEVVVTPSPDLPHQITSIVRNGDGSFTVNFLGAPNLSYAVQISSNLVEWVSVKTNTAAANGTWSYDDFSATNAGMRLYRSARR
jgi:hypothetical protein